MANYNSLEDMLNTTEKMECLVNNTRHDDDVMQFVGVDWFKPESVKLSKQQSAAPAPKMHQPRHCFC